MTTPAMTPAIQLALEADFGSVANWHAQFLAPAQASGASVGQVQLVFDPLRGTLQNRSLTDPVTAPADGVTLLTLDPREHTLAEQRDTNGWGTLDWAGAGARYQAAVFAASEDWGVAPADLTGRLVLDVRRAAVYEQAPTQLPGAPWRDPARVAQWAPELPPDTPIVVYCVHGHEVSRAITLRLRAAGLNAGFLRGGIEAWAASRGALDARAERR